MPSTGIRYLRVEEYLGNLAKDVCGCRVRCETRCAEIFVVRAQSCVVRGNALLCEVSGPGVSRRGLIYWVAQKPL